MLTNSLNKNKVEIDRLLENRDRKERMAIQELYVSAVEDRVADIALELRAQIAEELRTQFNAELERRVASIRGQYEMLAENAPKDVLGLVPPELVEEIAVTQSELLKKENELAGYLANDTTSSLGAISRLRVETRELTAYLKGLNFCGKLALERR